MKPQGLCIQAVYRGLRQEDGQPLAADREELRRLHRWAPVPRRHHGGQGLPQVRAEGDGLQQGRGLDVPLPGGQVGWRSSAGTVKSSAPVKTGAPAASACSIPKRPTLTRCSHGAGFRVYRRGPGPSYPFLPAGLACPKCGRFFPAEEPVGKQAECTGPHADGKTCPVHGKGADR